MTTDSTLIEKREELKHRLAAGEYKTLVDIFLAWTNRVIQKITRRTKPAPTWIITIILCLGSTLLGFSALYIAGESLPTYNVFRQLGLTFRSGTLWLILLNALNTTSMVLLNHYTQRIFILWRDNLLDITESTESLLRFENWIGTACNKRLHLLITLIGGALFSLYMVVASTSIMHGISFSYGSIFGLYIICMIASASIYLLWVDILLSAKLHQYDLKLFPTDPSSSEIISRLSNTLGFLIYIVAFSGTIGALLTALSGKLFQILGIAQILLIWVPLGIIFFIHQSCLSSIIRRAKWKTLNEVQLKIEKLQASKNFGGPKTMDAIGKLMDFHDRVKATRNSAIDSRTVLNFINSLLLPLLAFLLGNLDKVLLLFSKKP